LGGFVVGSLRIGLSTVILGVLCFSPFAFGADAPGAAKNLLIDEVHRLTFFRAFAGSTKKDFGDPRAAKLAEKIAKLAGKEKVKLAEMTSVAAELEAAKKTENLAELATLVKFQRKLEELPAASAQQAVQALLLDSMLQFEKMDAPITLSPELSPRVLKEIQTMDASAGRAPRKGVTGSGLNALFTKPYFEASKSEPKFSSDDLMKVASAGDYAAALYLGDEALRMRAAQAERDFRALSPGLKPTGRQAPAPQAPAPQPQASAIPRSMGEMPPQAGGGGQQAGGGHAEGGSCEGGGAMVQNVLPPGASVAPNGGLMAEPANLSDATLKAAARAPRKSLRMEVGSLFQDPMNPENAYFSPTSLCQATFVRPTAEPVQCINGVEQHLLMTANHCFNSLGPGASISLEGLGIIDLRKTVLRRSAEDDFAVMGVDLPCGTRVNDDILAPPGTLAVAGDQAMVLDVQQTGAQSVAGRTMGLDGFGRMGVNVLGQGRIFPGDSGGRAALLAANGQTYYYGATSTKLVDEFYRDAVGTVAVVPPWVYAGIALGEFNRRVPEERQLARRGKPDFSVVAVTH
jgi:hypothetical protein